MNDKLRQLNEVMAEIEDIRHSQALLGWDQQVYMPTGGAEERGFMQGTLGKIAHEKFVNDEMGLLLEDLKKQMNSMDPDSDDYRIIKVTAKDFDQERRVPIDFIIEREKVTSLAQQAWMKARSNSDFSIFLPHLERVIDLAKHFITFFPASEHPYDTLLDMYEDGMKTSDVQLIFSSIRPKQVELIKAISEKPQVDDSFLKLPYEENKMWEFSARVAAAFGYDFSRGRQDPTAHPFCQSIGPDDVRITSRWVPKLPFALLFGTMHETGHALYEQGIGKKWSRTALEGGTSLGIHESQSRMWENLVGRSRPFWNHFYPELQDIFRSQLGNVSLDQFYRAINKVAPSFIRVEADEATYNLHIMLRLEIEIGIIGGTMNANDLPMIWNEKMKDYLGVVPPNDALGVLQDVHWSGGMMGYFSTYALGNLVSAQLWEQILKSEPEISTKIQNGDFNSLLAWLRTNIHQHGRKYPPKELIQRVTNSPIDPEPYIRYLSAKYGEIYHL